LSMKRRSEMKKWHTATLGRFNDVNELSVAQKLSKQ
jgi:hypothetical protein